MHIGETYSKFNVKVKYYYCTALGQGIILTPERNVDLLEALPCNRTNSAIVTEDTQVFVRLLSLCRRVELGRVLHLFLQEFQRPKVLSA